MKDNRDASRPQSLAAEISNSKASQNTTNAYSLLAPGPVNLHPQVCKILGEAMIHHRTPEFDQIFKRVLLNLKIIFQTENPVFIHPSTGSGGMESLIVNTLSPGDEILVIVSGKFGERWADMAEVYGIKVQRIQVPWGQGFDAAELPSLLTKYPKICAVLTQACETSTAVFHPIEAMGKILKQYPEILFLVDGITALGALPLPMDSFGIDGLVGGSQKAFMLPTGLSFVSFSKKAWQKIEVSKTPKYYFDIQREQKANKNGESFFSAPVPLIKALDWVIADILRQGLSNHYATIESRAHATREFFKEVGLSLFSKAPSASLTAVNAPDGVDGQKWRLDLESRFNITVMGGQDQLKGKILRIGHMGYIQRQEMQQLYVSSIESLRSLDPKAVQKSPTEIEVIAKKWSNTVIEVS